MCGIAGILSSPPLEESHILQAMSESLKHRGPDNQTIYISGEIGLVHTRLSIIDIEGGNQPIHNENKTVSLIANGEIYNFIELRHELEAKGAKFKTNSDCETILKTYEENSESFISRLNGMFAFAIYDKKRKILTLARDRLGIKPLFYTIQNGKVIFASEIKAILVALDFLPEIIESSLLQFLQNQFISGRETIFKDIYKILPGELLEINSELQTSFKQYWDPISIDFHSDSTVDLYSNFEDSFNTVINQHIRSDVPFGLFLSGGVDSAVLLSMLSKYHEHPISTFSVGFEGREKKNEIDDAQYIANKFGSKHHTLLLNSDDIFNRIPLMTWAADELMRDYASLPTLALSEFASQELKVIFSGEGGDEAFAGYRRYRNKILENYFKNLLHPGTEGFRTRGQLLSLGDFFKNSTIIKNSNFRKPFKLAWQSCPDNWSYMQKAQYTDIKTSLPDNLLVKSDRMLMAYGLEGRVPFVDHRIIEFGLSLPDNLKYRNKKGKYFLKKWAEQDIPPEYLHRKKLGFYVPVDMWLTKEPFKHFLKQKLTTNHAICNWFDTKKIDQIFQSDKSIMKYSRHIMCFLQFAIWHNMYTDSFKYRPASNENILDLL